MNITVASENSLILYFGEEVSPELTHRIASFLKRVQQAFGAELIDFVPSYISLLLVFSPAAFDINKTIEQLRELAKEKTDDEVRSEPIHHYIPVCYDERIAPDLAALSDSLGLSQEELIQIHTGTLYTAYAIGFMPDFAFLGLLDNRICHPRHATPRQTVAAGSVGIAENQTGIYPKETPGGWQIIGIQPQLAIGQLATKEPVNVGDNVSFEAIAYDKFQSITVKP